MEPLVSVRVLAYNHEKYIANCLEGILMQKTDFPYEIIIGEDCSTDKTKEIVLAYQKQYPQIIKIITSQKNVGSAENSIRVQKACQGKYQAICEGDDYWIDPLKLQKQVDIMEAHPEFSMCFHDAISIWENKVSYPRYSCPDDLGDYITMEDLLQRSWFIPTASMLIRSEVCNSIPEWRKDIWCGDLLNALWSAHHGKLKYVNEVMSIYRRHYGGISIKLRGNIDSEQEVTDFTYRQFDKETNYVYSELIRQAIKSIGRNFQYCRLKDKYGLFVFVLRPDKTVSIIKRIFKFISQSKIN